jgi:hypothetical protein
MQIQSLNLLRYPLQRARLWWSVMRPMPKSVFDRQPFDNVSGVQQVTDLFRAIDKPNLSKWPETDHQNRAEAISKKFGFRLSVKPSTLPGAGNGVFLNGVREKGQIVSVYPGKN